MTILTNGELMTSAFKHYFIILVGLSLISNFSEANSCKALLYGAPNGEASTTAPAHEVLPSQMRASIVRELTTEFQIFREQHPNLETEVSLNLSASGRLSLQTKPENTPLEAALQYFITTSDVYRILERVPLIIRNKFFVISFGAGQSLSIRNVFPWERDPFFTAVLRSGFAQTDTDVVRRYQGPEAGTRMNSSLVNQIISQETYVTCGLTSIKKILNARGIEMDEEELLSLADYHGIKSAVDVLLSANQGFELHQLKRLLDLLGPEYGFSVRMVEQDSELSSLANFASDILRAARGENTDIILNYYSPGIGRPGKGHYSPVGGFSPSTSEVLVSEVNLVSNPPFWVKLLALFSALTNADDETALRGYLVLEWTRPSRGL